MVVQIQLRRGTASQWYSANPTLRIGEMGVETDTQKYKIGDGVTAWNSLAYPYQTSTWYWVSLLPGVDYNNTTLPSVTIPTLTFTFAASNVVTASASVLGYGITPGMYIYDLTDANPISLAVQIIDISQDGKTIVLASSYAGHTGATKTAAVLGHQLTMITDKRAVMPPGTPIKYTISGIPYYGVVGAITSTLLTIRGVSLGITAANITAMSYGDGTRKGSFTISIPSYCDPSNDATTVNDRLLLPGGLIWEGAPTAYIVGQDIQVGTADGGTYQPIFGLTVNNNTISPSIRPFTVVSGVGGLTFTFALGTVTTTSGSITSGGVIPGAWIYNSTNDSAVYASRIGAIDSSGVVCTLQTSYSGTLGATKTAYAMTPTMTGVQNNSSYLTKSVVDIDAFNEIYNSLTFTFTNGSPTVTASVTGGLSGTGIVPGSWMYNYTNDAQTYACSGRINRRNEYNNYTIFELYGYWGGNETGFGIFSDQCGSVYRYRYYNGNKRVRFYKWQCPELVGNWDLCDSMTLTNQPQLVGNPPQLATLPSCALYIRPTGTGYRDWSPQHAILGTYGTAPTQSGAQQQFPGGSVNMNTAGSVYSPSSTNFNLGNNWLVSCGVYLTSISGLQIFFSRDNSTFFQWYINGTRGNRYFITIRA